MIIFQMLFIIVISLEGGNVWPYISESLWTDKSFHGTVHSYNYYNILIIISKHTSAKLFEQQSINSLRLKPLHLIS